MLIIANGPRKSGTHLLKRCIQLMGIDPINGVIKPNGYDPKDNINAVIQKDQLLRMLDGKERVGIGHLPYAHRYRSCKMVTMIRDPRDIVCSFYRWVMKRKETMIYFHLKRMDSMNERLSAIIRNMNKVGLRAELESYNGYLLDSTELVVKFEDLIVKNENVVKTIAWSLGETEYMNPENVEKISENLIGHTLTYDPPSPEKHWSNYFTKNVYKAFEREGGNEIVKQWGYKV